MAMVTMLIYNGNGYHVISWCHYHYIMEPFALLIHVTLLIHVISNDNNSLPCQELGMGDAVRVARACHPHRFKHAYVYRVGG